MNTALRLHRAHACFGLSRVAFGRCELQRFQAFARTSKTLTVHGLDRPPLQNCFPESASHRLSRRRTTRTDSGAARRQGTNAAEAVHDDERKACRLAGDGANLAV